MRMHGFVVALLALPALTDCATRPIDEPITRFDPNTGYRPYLLVPKRLNNDPHTLFVLAFSGGGTRAAAFSYGVLEELRRSEIAIDEQRFLKRNVEGDLILRALNPFYCGKFIGGSAGRSELAAEYYDEILVEGAAYADLLTKQGPVAIANGSDLSTGSRFSSSPRRISPRGARARQRPLEEWRPLFGSP